MSGRRWPFVTLGILVTCLFALILFEHAEDVHDAKVRAATSEIVAYFTAHSYLAMPKAVGGGAPVAESPFGAAGDLPPELENLVPKPRGQSDDERAAEQARLDAMAADLAALAKDAPDRRWGYVPADGVGPSLVTSIFLHSGWLHLLGNAWFLWLCGCNVEDRWGRLVFLPFFVISGVVAALAHKLLSPASAVPLIGASGAVAGAMGAFLVLYATTRIRFFYWFGTRPGTFWAPAYLMLPLWLFEQLVWGLAMPSTEGGVAYWAHVGGFLFGAGVALTLKLTGIDARLDAAMEQSVSKTLDPRVMRAGDLITAGNPTAALAMLDALASERPKDIDVLLEMLRGAKAANDAKRQEAAYRRLVKLYVDDGALDAAADLHAEARQVGIEVMLSPEIEQHLRELRALKGPAIRR